MNRFFIPLTIFLLFTLLVMGWQLGQVKVQRDEAESRLITTQIEKESLQETLLIKQAYIQELEDKFKEPQVITCNTLRPFSSLEELQAWLAEDDTNERQYSEDFNCIHFALTLQEHAMQDGYFLNTEIFPIAAHWGNLAVIGNKIYLIEPQTDEIVIEKVIPR